MKNRILIHGQFHKIWRIIFSLFLIFNLTANYSTAQDELNVIHGGNSNWLYFSDAENSLYNHISQQAYELLEKRAEEVAGIVTLSEWQKRQEQVKAKLKDIIGPFPEKTPLNAKVLRTVNKDNYKIEHIIFESRPGFYVTSSMFIPKKAKGKLPVVIYCSGHSDNGYRSEVYQHKILNLVKKGFIVFAFDPVGQGERYEYLDTETGKSIVGGATKEHSYPGAQAFLIGDSQAGYMTWDGVRSIDYLVTRKEVDPKRIGITGRSGGGTQSAYIAAVDERIYATAPECYITNLARVFQSIGPQDAEQNLYNGIFHGIDHADYLMVRAPKPALMITTTNDFFSIQGARETAKEVSNIYNVYNESGNFSMVEDIAIHASTLKNREAMYAFFQKHLNNQGNPLDEEVELLTPEELRVTPTGQVSTSLNSETVYSLNLKEADKLHDVLKASRIALASDNYQSNVLQSARKLSGYREAEQIDDPVFTGSVQRNGYVIEKYYIKGEGNYPIPYLLLIPETSNNKALIYIHPSGKNVEASVGGEMEWFVNQGFTVIAPDLIGVGETGPGDYRGDAYIEGISYNIWFGSMLIGRSIAGIRAADVNRLARLLENTIKPSEIYGLARNEMTPVLLHAASFNASLARLALIEPYVSYMSIVTNHFYKPSFIHSNVPGSLKAYDLPDLAALLSPRKLLMVNVTDGKGEMTDDNIIMEDLSVIKSVYSTKKSMDKLKILSGQSSDQLREELLNWSK